MKKKNYKESENAKAVAKDVIAKVRKGEKVNMQEIQHNHGYTKKSAKSMKAKETEAYKKTIKPIVVQLEKERQRIIDELKNKDLSEERYKDLVDGLDKMTKNIQLLGNRPTEITKHKLSQEEQEKIDSLLDN